MYIDWKASRPGTVAGTFEDLNDEERTKAFLQLLEYRLKLEKDKEGAEEGKDERFHELWQRLPAPEVNSPRYTYRVPQVFYDRKTMRGPPYIRSPDSNGFIKRTSCFF